jgi:hypothetical protein
MIFSENKRKIRALESQIEDLKDRVFALEQNTKYYTDIQMNMFSRGVGWSPLGDPRHYETVALADVVRKIAKHLNMTVNLTRPTESRIEAHFGEKE